MNDISVEIQKNMAIEMIYAETFDDEGLDGDDAEIILEYLNKSNSINRVLYRELEREIAKNELFKKGD